MRMYIRPIDQGQVVEIAYGYGSDGRAYKRVTDRSEPFDSPDREKWYSGMINWDEEPEHEDDDRIPCVHEWRSCEGPAGN